MTAKVIVAGQPHLYAFLADKLGAQWDLQTLATSVEDLWAKIETDPPPIDGKNSLIAIVSDRLIEDGKTTLPATIAALSALAVIVVCDDYSSAGALGNQVTECLRADGLPTDPAQRITYLSSDDQAALAHAIRTNPLITGVVSFGPAPVLAPIPLGATEAPPAPSATQTSAVARPAAPAAAAGTSLAAPHVPALTPDLTQATADAIAEPAAPPAEAAAPWGQYTFAFTSSKGGAGKTTAALCTASQIALSSLRAYEQGLVPRPLRVVVVDMDTGDGQVGMCLGQNTPTAMNLRVVSPWNEENVLKHLVHQPAMGIDALLAPTKSRSAADVPPNFYDIVIKVLQRTHDVVILDTSVRYLDELNAVAYHNSTGIVFVTTMARTAVLGMARALKEFFDPNDARHGGLGIPKGKVGILVNQVARNLSLEKADIEHAGIGAPIIGTIPMATEDAVKATNLCRLEQLLMMPQIGAHYFKFAQALISPDAYPLAPLVGGPPSPQAPAVASPARGKLFSRARTAVGA